MGYSTRRYHPGAGRTFWISDPKQRCIFAMPFRDQVAQHWLIGNVLADLELRLVTDLRLLEGPRDPLLPTPDGGAPAALGFRAPTDHAILRQKIERIAARDVHWLLRVFLGVPMVVARADFHFL